MSTPTETEMDQAIKDARAVLETISKKDRFARGRVELSQLEAWSICFLVMVELFGCDLEGRAFISLRDSETVGQPIPKFSRHSAESKASIALSLSPTVVHHAVLSMLDMGWVVENDQGSLMLPKDGPAPRNKAM